MKGNGNGSILGTCDAGRERECSKELVNVFSQVIEWIQEQTGADADEKSSTSAASEPKSFHDSLAAEIAEMKKSARKSSQDVQSVDVVSRFVSRILHEDTLVIKCCVVLPRLCRV